MNTTEITANARLARARNQQTYIQNPSKLRPNRGVSMTVPDQSMSLRQILERFQRGLPITGNTLEPEYNEEGQGIDLRTLDLTEKAILAEQYQHELKGIADKITTHNSKKEKDALKAALKAELEAEAKALEEMQNKLTDKQAVKQ